jgi:apolipoprotein N-acyltransferase
MKSWSNDKWLGAGAALLSGAILALSRETGHFGYLALIGPVPLLIWALRFGKVWNVLGHAFVAGLMAEAGLMLFYGKDLPVVYAIAAFQALMFALTVLFMAGLYRRTTPVAAMLGFAAMTAGSYYLYGLVSPNGSFSAPGYALVDVLPLLQGASLGGMSLLSFMAALIPAGLALSLLNRRGYGLHTTWGLPVLLLSGFGVWQMAQPQGETVRVALLSDNRQVARVLRDPASDPEVVGAFAKQIEKVAVQKPVYIVIPEKIVLPGRAFQGLSDRMGAGIVAGVDAPQGGGGRLNLATLTQPKSAPLTYSKQRMVPGLEAEYVPGNAPLITGRIGIAICKDMDFPEVLRPYGQKDVKLMLVPAWDFVADARLHSRMAIVRGVENGFAVARSASQGLMTLSDAHGRIMAEQPAVNGPALLVDDLPTGRGHTLYSRIGDVFAQAMLALWLGLLALLVWRHRK